MAVRPGALEWGSLEAADNDETSRLADLIEGVAGEFSPFEHLHGFSIDGVDLSTSVLPPGWRERLVPVRNANAAAPSGGPAFTRWCLDKEDCVAKLCALREKDRNFVSALLDAGLVDADTILQRHHILDDSHAGAAFAARAWLTSRCRN